MVAYSFRPRFVDPICAGLEPGGLVPGMKRQTIRNAAGGKRHARPGELVQLYTGMRTRSCRLLGVAVCIAVEPVSLYFTGCRPCVAVNSVNIADADLDAFARWDGFADWAGLRAFWAAEHPGVDQFLGVLIRWEPQP